MINTAFGELEDKILETGNENLLSIYENLENLKTKQVSNFGEVLKYTLAVSAIFEKNNILDKYFHIGGGAVLLHIANTIGIEKVSKWRGTHDLDIVTTEFGIENYLKNYFEKFDCYNSPSISNKKHIDIKDYDAEDKVQIDLYIPNKNKDINVDGSIINSRILKELKTIKVLGIKAKVPKLHDILSSKLKIETKKTKLPREKDISDIYNLLGCIEKCEGIRNKYSSIEDLSRYISSKVYFEKVTLPEKLVKLIEYGENNKIENIICKPSKNLLIGIKNYIKKK